MSLSLVYTCMKALSNAVNGAAQDEDSDREPKKVILFAVWC